MSVSKFDVRQYPKFDCKIILGKKVELYNRNRTLNLVKHNSLAKNRAFVYVSASSLSKVYGAVG